MGKPASRQRPGVEYLPKTYEQFGFNATRPLVNLGTGDSSLHFDILPSEVADTAFEILRNEVGWNTMLHKDGEVQRRISIQGAFTVDREGSQVEPVYRHPEDEEPAMEAFTPFVSVIRDAIQQRLGIEGLNHVRVQHYQTSRDFISEHADKSLDIAPGSFIINVSIGATRDFILRPKRDRPSDERREKKQTVSLPHNSAFVLGLETNRDMTHAIRQDKRDVALKRADELLQKGERISLTFRKVGTWKRLCDNVLFGQGAKLKESPPCLIQSQRETATDLEMLDDGERMLAAFAAENSQSGFCWDTHYEDGFASLSMKLLNARGLDVDL